MKKYWHIALMLFCVLMITSCGDDDEALEVDEVWKVQNEEAFQAQMLVPGIAIVILVSAFNLMGDAIRDVLDPKEVL